MSDREDFLNRYKADKESQEKTNKIYEKIKDTYNEDGSLKKENSEGSDSTDNKDGSDGNDDFDDMSNDLREKESDGRDSGRERSRELSRETDDGGENIR